MVNLSLAVILLIDSGKKGLCAAIAATGGWIPNLVIKDVIDLSRGHSHALIAELLRVVLRAHGCIHNLLVNNILVLLERGASVHILKKQVLKHHH